MATDDLMLKISDHTDEILYNLVSESGVKNIEWDLVVDENNDTLEIMVEDLGTAAGIRVTIEKEDLFCAAMSIKRRNKKNVIFEMSGLIAGTLLDNLAMASIDSLLHKSPKNKIRDFFDRIKKKKEDDI